MSIILLPPPPEVVKILEEIRSKPEKEKEIDESKR